jgi:hypothetical protein
MSDDSKVTFYDVLGVAEDATFNQIRTSYYRQAKIAHPDMGGSAHTMRLLNRAFRVLKDPELRARYDRTLHESKDYEKNHGQAASPPPPTPKEPSPTELIRQEKQAVSQIKMAAKKIVAKGVGLLILGVIITAIGYNMASPGGTYFILWGLMIWGIVEIFRGWYHALNPYASLHKILDHPGQPHKFLLEKQGRRSWALSVIILSCIGVFITISILASSSSGGTGSTSSYSQSQSTITSATDSRGYPAAYFTSFTQSCLNNGGNSVGCACALNVVESMYTYEQALQIDASGTLPPELSTRVSNTCR